MKNAPTGGPRGGGPAPSHGTLAERGFWIFFLLFPLVLALAGRTLVFSRQEDPERRAMAERLETAINQVDSNKEPLEYFSRLFRRIERRVFSRPDPIAAWEKVVPALKRRYPGMIETVFVDGSGLPHPRWTERSTPRLWMQRFFLAYQQFLLDRTPLPSSVSPFLKAYLGPFTPIGYEIHGNLVYRSPQPKELFSYLSRPYPTGMFFVFFRPYRRIRDLALQEEIARLNQTGQGIRLCLASYGQRTSSVHAALRLAGVAPKAFWPVLERSPDGTHWFGDTLVSRRSLFPSRWVIGAAVRTKNPETGTFPILFLVLLLLAAGWWIPHLSSVRGEGAFSVRVRLLAAFLYSALVPLLIMGFTAQIYLGERREVLERETHSRTERAIQGIDRRFSRHVEGIGERLKNYHFASPDAPSDGFQDFRQRLPTLQQEFRFDSCRVYDQEGREVFTHAASGSPIVFHSGFKAFGEVARHSFAQSRSPGRVASSSAAEDRPARMGLAGFSIPGIQVKPRFFEEIHLADFRAYVYCLPLGRPPADVTHFAFLLWSRRMMAWNYLTRHLPALGRSFGGGEFLVWDPAKPGGEFPPDFRRRRLVQPFLERVTSQGSSFRTKIERGEGAVLLTGLQGSLLEGFSFLGLVSDQEIRSEIDGLAWRFRFITLAIIGACLIIGFLLARVFLDPLADLTRGVEAIRKRHFSFRLPPGGNDELGRLGHLFNETLEGLKDLEIARTVQEHILPREALTHGAWTVEGSCVPAMQVGGDFYHSFLREDGRIQVVAGTVAGGGVGGALVAGMVKAFLEHPGTPHEPGAALACLEKMLTRLIHQGATVTCGFAVLQPETRHLRVSGAGGGIPVQVHPASGSATGTDQTVLLPVAGRPLGSGDAGAACFHECHLEPGDVVMLFTLGVFSSLTEAGIPPGKWLAELPKLLRANAGATLRATRDWL